MTVIVRAGALALCAILAAVGTGCALRATTDFGPQSGQATRTLSAGPQGLPGGVSGVSGPDGDSIGLRDNGGTLPSADRGETGR